MRAPGNGNAIGRQARQPRCRCANPVLLFTGARLMRRKPQGQPQAPIHTHRWAASLAMSIRGRSSSTCELMARCHCLQASRAALTSASGRWHTTMLITSAGRSRQGSGGMAPARPLPKGAAPDWPPLMDALLGEAFPLLLLLVRLLLGPEGGVRVLRLPSGHRQRRASSCSLPGRLAPRGLLPVLLLMLMPGGLSWAAC